MEQQLAVDEHHWIDPADGNITFGDYFREWIEARNITSTPGLANRLREHFVTDAAPDHADSSAVPDAVLRLRRSHRELIMLIHWDGLTILEAAELLGLNASTARCRYSAARSSLREALMLATTAD